MRESGNAFLQQDSLNLQYLTYTYVSVESRYCNKSKVARLAYALGTNFLRKQEINNQPSNQKQHSHTHGVIPVSFHAASPVCRTGREGGLICIHVMILTRSKHIMGLHFACDLAVHSVIFYIVSLVCPTGCGGGGGGGGGGKG